MAAHALYLGLISGTSVDGIDAAIVQFDDDHGPCRAAMRFGRTYPWEAALQARLVALGQQAGALTLDDLGELDTRIADGFADAACRALADAGFRVRRNSPFAGAHVAATYGRPLRGRHVVQVEIDRSLYMDEGALRPHAGFDELAARLEGVIARIARLPLDGAGLPLAAE